MPKTKSSTTIDDRGITAADGSRKALIERTALTLFVSHGVEATTTKMIASEAGISEGALYYHFKNKEEIASSMFFAIHLRLAELIRAIGARGATLEVKADAIVSAFCATADDDWPLFQYHLLYTHRFLPGPQASDNPVQAIEDIITDAVKVGDLPNCDVALVAAMALGAVSQVALHKVFKRITTPLSDHKTPLQDAVRAVLRAQR